MPLTNDKLRAMLARCDGKKTVGMYTEMFRELAEEVLRLREENANAIAFRVGPDRGAHWAEVIEVHRCEGYMLPIQPVMWKVTMAGNVLAKDGEWEWEPQPSSRDKKFYKRCRFATKEEAFAAAEKKVRSDA